MYAPSAPEELARTRPLTWCGVTLIESFSTPGQAEEVFGATEPVRAGLDGVAGLLQELADVADALVDCLGPDAGQGGDGDLW